MAGFDITERVVYDLSTTIAAAYFPTDAAWDCSIGGLPFMLAVDQTRPMDRLTSQFRRTRIDQERDPGENSLDQGLWLRSVASTHYGAGQRSQESLEVDQTIARFRYYRSANIDPWTAGQTTLGEAVTLTHASSEAVQYVLGIGGGDVLHGTGSTLNVVSSTGVATAVAWGGTGNILSLTTDGANYFAVSNTNIYKGSAAGGAGASMLSSAYASTSNVLLRSVKQRLIFALSNVLYEITSGTTTLPTVLFTHPNASWTWTGVADGPDSIYLAGYAGEQSVIYKTTVSASTGGAIALATPIVLAELPRGEVVRSIYSYLGNYLAIGTTVGVRLALINADGTITVGPVTIACTGGVFDFVGHDRFLYATGGSATTGLDGAASSGVYRIDLSVEVDKLRFAYSQESTYASGSAAPSAVTYSGTQLHYTIPSVGLVSQAAATTFAADGWIEYGKINYSTAENKAWRSVLLRADVPTGTSVEVHASTSGTGNPSSWPTVGTLTSAAPDGEFVLSVPAPNPDHDMYVALRLTTTVSSLRPVVYAVSVRAFPAPKRTRMLHVPLLCFDHERDRYGMVRGYDGGAWDRLAALEAAEDLGSIVLWQDFTTGETRQALIDAVAMQRTTPPSREKDNSGGILTVTLKLL